MEKLVPGFKNYTSVSSALETISRLTKLKPTIETVRTKDSYSRVVSENIMSPINVPDKQWSHMGGYARRRIRPDPRESSIPQGPTNSLVSRW